MNDIESLWKEKPELKTHPLLRALFVVSARYIHVHLN